MSLAAGTKLGPYEILSPIGAGGMGEVYRARDPRLARDVAVKVLPASYSEDADRLRRFEQEAKAAGALHHPNITAVFDIGQHDGGPYIVQELLEGETLRATLATGRLSARRVVDYAIGIARGLAAAHEKGIVHRDLKPENVFVTNDGQVKILDFGLAKLTEAEGLDNQTNLPTATRGTEPGVVMGTLGYMSPEQVRGKPADHRSDIFSFGAIFYEMLSGRRAFQGDSAADTMSAILKEDPPELSVTNQNVSPALDRIVRHCLEKAPERRLHSAHDLAFELEALSQTSGTVAAAATSRGSSKAMRRLLGAAALAAAVIAAFLVGRRGSPARAATGTMPRTYQQLTNYAGAEGSPGLSPDGQLLAFTRKVQGGYHIWVQRAGGHNATDLTASCDQDSSSPAFSPDGALIAYGSQCGGGGLFVMGATGENNRRLAPIGGDPAWSPDGTEIVYNTETSWAPWGRSTKSELWIVEVATGKTRRLFEGDAIQPSVSPHGLRVAYWGLPDNGSQRDIWTIPYKGLGQNEKPVPVTQDPALDWNPVWSADGRFLYFLSNRDGSMNLWRVSIDEGTGKTLGPPEPRTLPTRLAYGFSISRDGKRAAFGASEFSYSIERVAFDAAGGKVVGSPVEIVQASDPIGNADVSPDGTLLAFDSQGSGQEDISLMRVDGNGMRKLVDDAPRDRVASFSPDGKRIVFQSDRSGSWQIWTILPDGSGMTQVTHDRQGMTLPLWSPDGRRIAATDTDGLAAILELDESGNAVKTTRLPAPAGKLVPMIAGWLGDGRLLISLNRREYNGVPEIATFDPKTGSYTPMKGPAGAYFGPYRLGPRSAVAVGGAGIWLLDPDGGEPRLLLPSPAAGIYISTSLTTDGKTLYLGRLHENADIWMATPP
ncbi:MAG TPA: protein kinase [Thermoanaerobaculia bacterium]|nr:protein kinase [Thermoanaerobaculia bacterium]